jgi:ubiquitin-conjugating enzyme E2 Z
LGLNETSTYESAETTPWSSVKRLYTNDFADLCKRLLLWHYHNYIEICERESQYVKDGVVFQRMPFESFSNHMDGTFQYTSLISRLKVIKEAIIKETESWITLSQEWLAKDSTVAANLYGQFQKIAHIQEFDGLTMELEGNNPYIWNIIIIGRPSR